MKTLIESIQSTNTCIADLKAKKYELEQLVKMTSNKFHPENSVSIVKGRAELKFLNLRNEHFLQNEHIH